MIAEAGKSIRNLMSGGQSQTQAFDAILKCYGLAPGGRNNQNLKALLEAMGE